jgi:hypothetical protein
MGEWASMPLHARQAYIAAQVPDAPTFQEIRGGGCVYRFYKARAGKRVLYMEAVRDDDLALCHATFQRFYEFNNDLARFGMPFVEPLLAELRASRPHEGVSVCRDSHMSQIEPERPCLKDESRKRRRDSPTAKTESEFHHAEDGSRKIKKESTTPPPSAATLRTPASLPTIAQDIPPGSDSALPCQAAYFAQVDSPQHQHILAQFRKPNKVHGVYTGRIGDE